MAVRFTERFVRQYERLPRPVQRKVDKALSLLDADFRHPGLRRHPVEGAGGVFEAYVDIKYRMTYERHADGFLMRNVDNRDECIRNP